MKVGDKVLISKYGGTEIKIDGENYLIMREDDIWVSAVLACNRTPRQGEPDKDKISAYARSFRTFRDAQKPH